MRAVGLDLGQKRIGVAVSDPDGVLAVPHGTVERTGDLHADRLRLAELVGELEAEQVVVGLPLSLDGSSGPMAQAALAEAEALGRLVGVHVECHDERLTTVSANRSLAGAGMRGARRKRKRVDAVAATVLLQSWLDSRR